ncbi:uncharacterized protein LOC141705546 [Apium graveolens]|uniref:uncharacterized protein LOC141705546 n=1 Tax=Apium graveolens TaxID=4045 RepID=UPI003D79B96E
METPTVMHELAAKRVLRYIRGTLNYGLVYVKGSGSELLTEAEKCGVIVVRPSLWRPLQQPASHMAEENGESSDCGRCINKALPTARFEKMRQLLGVRDLQTVA